MSSTIRLTPALVLGPLWGRSVHNSLTRTKWEVLRRNVLEASGNSCRHCNAHYDKGMILEDLMKNLTPINLV